jgi:hypothetical protein
MIMNPKILARLNDINVELGRDRYHSYISGPMTGLPEYNKPAFDDAAAFLRAQGKSVYNPASDADIDNTRPRKYYMRQDIEALLMCESIVMIEGWEKSSGAKLELAIAKELEMPVYFLSNSKLKPSVE